MMDLDAIHARTRDVYRGRKWILAPDAAVAATGMAAYLREAGAADVMVIAAVEGVGDPPDVEHTFYTRTSGPTIMTSFRAFYASLEDPSPALAGAVAAFDPEGEAMVLGGGFSRAGTLVGRQVYGRRTPAWRALEDKTLADGIWDDAGIPRAPSAVVPVSDAATAAGRLAGPLGSVWVADNSEGWHGGGEYTRWVQTPHEHRAAAEWFADHAEAVRVMPFLDGLPCSIHGFITPNGVAVFRPVELFILRREDRRGFWYGAGANYWSPPTWLFDEMRAAARAVASVLIDRVGYLGAFGIDGVATPDGFRPTELNPRQTIGHGMHVRPLEIPLDHMEKLMFEGDLDIDAADLERTVLDGTERRRHGRALFLLDESYPPAKTAFVFDDGRAIAVDEESDTDGTMEIGDATQGSIILCELDRDRTPIGPSFAPRTLQLLELARKRWGIAIPELTHAPDLTAL